MEIKELIREKVLTEIITERDGMVLELNEMVGKLQAEAGGKAEEIQRLQERVKELEGKITNQEAANV